MDFRKIALYISALSIVFSCSGGGDYSTAPIDNLDFSVKGVSFSLTDVPGNAFTKGLSLGMGSLEGETAELVFLDGYAISSPVTEELYEAVMGKGGSSQPKTGLSLKDAQKFVQKLSKLTSCEFSIPTLAQYEYATRYGFVPADNKFQEWVIDPDAPSKDVARDPNTRKEYAPGTTVSNIGFRLTLNTNKPVSQAIVDAYTSFPKRESSERTKETIEVAGVSFTMVNLPAGSFMMGGTEADQGKYAKEDELPVHVVSLDSFEIGETEVTAELWNAVMGRVPAGNFPDKYPLYPVVNVSWYEAQMFIQKLNSLTGRLFRLPTEAEWEYAARGGMSAMFRYAGSNNITTVAVYGDETGSNVKPVKSLSPTSLGLYDMSGNVWEWCQDWYAPYTDEGVENPSGPETGETKVLRGGSVSSRWNSCRVSNREAAPAQNIKSTFGLRLAL